jgi:hypothetical protein
MPRKTEHARGIKHHTFLSVCLKLHLLCEVASDPDAMSQMKLLNGFNRNLDFQIILIFWMKLFSHLSSNYNSTGRIITAEKDAFLFIVWSFVMMKLVYWTLWLAGLGLSMIIMHGYSQSDVQIATNSSHCNVACTTGSFCVYAYKKKCGYATSSEEKELFNTSLAHAKIRVEHCIGLLKN